MIGCGLLPWSNVDLSDINEVLSKDKQYENWRDLQSYFSFTLAFQDYLNEHVCKTFPIPTVLNLMFVEIT